MDARARVWQRLQRDSWHGVEQITVMSSPVLVPCTVELSWLTVLTGTHGAGKSYLLRLLDSALPWGYSDPIGPPFYWYQYNDETFSASAEGRLEGIYQYSFRQPGESYRWKVDYSAPRPIGRHEVDTLARDIWSVYVDPASAFWDYSMYFQEADNPRQGDDSQVLRRADVDRLRDILGRRYDRVTYRTVVLGGQDVVPYVECAINGRVVGNHTMSMGELWVHYCLWRLRRADSGCVVLIDEPEAFLSPAGHAAFLDEIARLAVARNCQVILATHSTAMIARTPPQLLRALTAGPAGTRVVRPSDTASALRLLGHSPGLAGIVFVEDELARTIVVAILSRFAPAFADRVDIIDAGGRDRALSCALVIARSATLRVCVVLDGDQRGVGDIDSTLPVTYLPGAVPDIEVLAPVVHAPALLAERLGISADEVSLALDAIRFREHQYWFRGLAQTLHVDPPVLIHHLISLWITQPSTEHQLRTVARYILDAVLTSEQTSL